MERQVQRSLQTIVSLPFYPQLGPDQDARASSVDQARAQRFADPIRESARSLSSRPLHACRPYLNPIDGTIYRPETRGGYDYEVLSDAGSKGAQDGETDPRPNVRRAPRNARLVARPGSGIALPW